LHGVSAEESGNGLMIRSSEREFNTKQGGGG